MVKKATVEARKTLAWIRRQPRIRRSIACFHCEKYTLPVRVLCHWKHCTEFYCSECGRYSWGAGPVGCPCDWGNTSGSRGHHTRAEQARPRRPVKPSLTTRKTRWTSSRNKTF